MTALQTFSQPLVVGNDYLQDGDEDDDAEYDDEDEEVGVGWSQREKDGCKTVENNGRKRKEESGTETVVYKLNI